MINLQLGQKKSSPTCESGGLQTEVNKFWPSCKFRVDLQLMKKEVGTSAMQKKHWVQLRVESELTTEDKKKDGLSYKLIVDLQLRREK